MIEQRLQLLTISRISRVTAIIHENETIPRSPVALVEVRKSRAEIEEARQLFLQSYMKQLP